MSSAQNLERRRHLNRRLLGSSNVVVPVPRVPTTFNARSASKHAVLVNSVYYMGGGREIWQNCPYLLKITPIGAIKSPKEHS